MFRHAIALNPMTWTAQPRGVKSLTAAWPADETLAITHPFGHVGRFRVAVAGGQLEIAGDIAAPPNWQYRPRQQPLHWYHLDHVVIFLDPAHDHATQRMLAVLRTGRVESKDQWVLCGEEVSDVQSQPLNLPPLNPQVAVRAEAGGGWRFRLRIALTALRRQPGARFPAMPMGLRIKLAVAGPISHEAPAWPPTDPFWKDTPFGFGDLYAPPQARGDHQGCVVTGVDFGRPVWATGGCLSTVKLQAQRSPAAPVAGRAVVRITDPLGKTTASAVRWQARRGQVVVTLPANYPFTAKWAPDILRIARLELDLRDRRGRSLWVARYPFGFDAGVLVREPFGQLTGARAQRQRPRPGDKNFVDRYRAWLLTLLPDWQWQSTRDGAPSDFFLRARGVGPAARKLDINLMSPTVYTDLARLIARLFPDWQDGLCAAAMALHHPCLTVHSSSWARVATNAHTDTVLRLGGCFCSDCSRIAARLAEELGALYRVPLKGFSLGLAGHLTGLVETPLGAVLIDPMLGAYYHTLDNRRHATLDELRTDKRIQLRMWSLAYSHGHEFFHGIYTQVKQPWLDGPLKFPPDC